LPASTNERDNSYRDAKGETMKLIGTRREFLRASAAAAGSSLLLSGCVHGAATKSEPASGDEAAAKNKESSEMGGEVTATEDLMREHGVLRRALLIYTATATKLREDHVAFPAEPLRKTATLFRDFGEEYHEKKLEEAYIFPAVKKAGGLAAIYADILLVQHARGREITDYILAVTGVAKLGAVNSEPLAKAMDALVLMYRNHAAREDTIVFPAWKQTLTAAELDEMNDKFEDIEHEQFGEDGYEEAVKQIADIESSLGLADLAQFTAPPPPKP
jgi:hemerythrin-like domain-containing protein